MTSKTVADLSATMYLLEKLFVLHYQGKPHATAKFAAFAEDTRRRILNELDAETNPALEPDPPTAELDNVVTILDRIEARLEASKSSTKRAKSKPRLKK